MQLGPAARRGPVEPARAASSGLTLLLYELQSPINIGMILRVAETYGVDVAILGSSGVLGDASKRRTISDFACGALERKGFTALESEAMLAAWANGRRLVATSIDPRSVPLPEFRFEHGDVVILGNEYDGLPASLAERCSMSLHIPMADVWTPKPPSSSPIDPSRVAPVSHDGQPNLNVAMAGAIVCYGRFVSGL